jgi:outer membrane protein assembly factor BamB
VSAADALGQLGPPAEAAVPHLMDAFTLDLNWVDVALMESLRAIGPKGVPYMVERFKNGEGKARIQAGKALWGMGALAKDARGQIAEVAQDKDEAVRSLAEGVLKKIDTEIREMAAAGRELRPAAESGSAPEAVNARSADWPGFHGPNRDSICPERGLLPEWPEGGPRLLWKIEGLGRGYSSVSIANGRLYTMGDRKGAEGKEQQFVLCYDLGSQKELWATRIGSPHADGGPRSVPTIDGAWVYALGTDGDLLCLAAESGKVRWGKSLTNELGGKVMSGWKFCESPLIDGEKLICTPGAKDAALAALNKSSGEVLWKAALPDLGPKGKDGAGYSSVVIADIAGQRQYVQILGRGAVGIAADTGKFLWGYNRIANEIANVPTPVVRGDRIFVTTSYNTGSALLRIHKDGDTWKAEEVYFLSPTQFENHHGGVVLVGDYLYGGKGLNRSEPTCIQFATGGIAWTQKPTISGSAGVLYADGHIIFRYDRGPVVLVEANPKEFRIKGKLTPPIGAGPAWPHPVIHQKKLFLRHADILLCYDLENNT